MATKIMTNLKNDPINVLVEGGLGDTAITIPWLESFKKNILKDEPFKIYARIPDLIDLCCPWARPVLTHEQYEKDFPSMAYSIVVTDMVMFRLAKQELFMPPHLAVLCQNFGRSLKTYGHYFKRFPLTAQMFYKDVVKAGFKREDFIFEQVKIPRQGFFYPVERPKDMPPKVLLVNDGFSAWHKTMRVTKNWDLMYWNNFLKAFKTKYEDIAIVQVGDSRSIPLSGVDIHLIGKTKLQELVAWLAHSDFYVGNDSGPYHIRHWYKKPSVILYGPSPEDYYGYPENINMAGDKCHPCYWQIPEWNEHCKLDWDDGCLRMLSIKPEAVLDAISKQIEGVKNV